ncbi:MAG: UvrD-helicase domain-containing protein [Dysgonamonadaceae bacterium]|nr:UvrD-helicase domain-containing protein [Dysgonamonadaceae bacterium]
MIIKKNDYICMVNSRLFSIIMIKDKQLKVFKASAGSGKTYTLAKEFIKEALIKDSVKMFSRILAVTFTKDATGEMKDRILAELYGLAFNTEDSAGFLSDLQAVMLESGCKMSEKEIREKANRLLKTIINDYGRLNITTIDSFFQKILRSLARELGAGSRFNIEINSAKVRLDAVNAIIENANNNPQLLDWLTTYVESKLEEDGNWRFQKEVYRFSACIYDEFFQEKEKELSKQLKENPEIIKDTIKKQRKIMKECRDVFKNVNNIATKAIFDAGIAAEEFINNGFVFKFLKKLAGNSPSKVNIGATINKLLDSSENWASKTNKKRKEIISIAEDKLIFMLSTAVNSLKKYNTSQLIHQNLHQLGLVWHITREIEEQNREQNRFMLSDTSQFLNKMIDGKDSPFIYEKIGEEIRHILIDEFQDTSRLQWGNFRTLLVDILASNLFSMIVGDAKQSIYRWRNGDWRILDNIDKDLGVTSETLPFNFRSLVEIVDFNNKFFVEAGKLLDEKCHEEFITIGGKSSFKTVYKENEVVQKARKLSGKGFVSIKMLEKDKENDTDFSKTVINEIIKRLETLKKANISANKICILTRKNSEIAEIANLLAAEKDNFPELAKENYLNIVSDDAFSLASSESVMEIINALKVIDNNDLAYLSPTLNVTEKLAMMPILEMISYIYRTLNLKNIDGQSQYLFAFFDSVTNYLKNHPADDLHAFITYWNEELSEKTIPSGSGIDGVRAMTIHKSKGLQFHTVIIPFCWWELNPKMKPIVWCAAKSGVYDLPLLPVNFSSQMEDTIFAGEYEYEKSLSWLDNLNLLYVAFTRAECNLIVFGKLKKSLAGTKNIITVSDILQWIMPILGTKTESVENFNYEFGELEQFQEEKTQITTNILKQSPTSNHVEFVSYGFDDGKSIFKQSNKSREFVNANVSVKEKYVAYGNIMHALFEKIRTMNDIENAVENLINEGIISFQDKEMYIKKINSAIVNAGKEDWFSEKYKVYSEFSILVKENEEITTKRPDRALISDNETIIIDYKFGKSHDSHRKQVKQYIDLLQSMNYPNVKGYLWYVELEEIHQINEI